ncbi:hypothetical protein TSA1_05680 [Bradyrhizobium nitroreducens]|uniref:T6SS immunity protein Tdi1 C-terminal domain-containing protein n=1 Tax=Bradyrhizobium nitroreducens TaxID=709803 RepID=A0A2M6U6S2_9BRAD|nr:T6SS immunity protein Tdi1 domain-containing protein [Bradyrhizobium nitroreducens]PIT00310.1 hypothetical protein TSA1_05680 [Bradyrhizobium nitroreducens]
MALLQIIELAWGWKGLRPASIIACNAFGNLIVKDTAGAYWRIIPEELSCAVVARGDDDYAALKGDADFMADWAMTNLQQEALGSLGNVPEGHCYCFKIPAVLGGEYGVSNLGTIALEELIAVAGNLSFQMDGLPDGTPVQFVIKPAE